MRVIIRAFQMIFDKKIYDNCQWTGTRSGMLIFATLNIETENSKPVERRGRKAMDLKSRGVYRKLFPVGEAGQDSQVAEVEPT